MQVTKAKSAKATAYDGQFDATDPDLAAFEKNGGKLILWADDADPAINPVGTISYYQAVARTMGALSRTESFARLFPLPASRTAAAGRACRTSTR